jgi:uncharacterized protein (TIGR02246 family)
MDAAELAAREAIRDLVARYAHAADRGRFDEVAQLFTERGTLHLPDGRELVGREAIRTFLAGTGAEIRDATARPFIRHHVSSHRIIVDGGDAATGFAYFFVVTERGPDHWGRYADRYVEADGAWLFAERRVRLDGFGPGSVAADRRR